MCPFLNESNCADHSILQRRRVPSSIHAASRPFSMNWRRSSTPKPKCSTIICQVRVGVTLWNVGSSVFGWMRIPCLGMCRIGWSSAQRSFGSVRR